jgi:hypothetical protein
MVNSFEFVGSPFTINITVSWGVSRKSAMGNRNFVHRRIVSAVRRAEFLSDMLQYIDLSGRCCKIIDLNVHVPSEEKGDDSNKMFMRNWRNLYHLPRY